MIRHQAGSGRTRRKSWSLRRTERGATLVEMALVLPILLLIIISIAEIGLYFKNYLTVSYASREGARVAAFVGDSMDADCQILIAVGELLGSSNLDNVQKVEIFVADQDGTQTLGKTNEARLTGDPTACNEPAEPSDGWLRTTRYPATNRNVTVAVDEPPLDIVGIRIYFTHNWAIGFPPFIGQANIDESNINRLEPEVFE